MPVDYQVLNQKTAQFQPQYDDLVIQEDDSQNEVIHFLNHKKLYMFVAFG